MWRVDETYLKVRGKWIYLYRSVDRAGHTVDFTISQQSDRAGPSLHQVPDERHGRLQTFQEHRDHARRHRVDASHSQGAILANQLVTQRHCRARCLEFRPFYLIRYPSHTRNLVKTAYLHQSHIFHPGQSVQVETSGFFYRRGYRLNGPTRAHSRDSSNRASQRTTQPATTKSRSTTIATTAIVSPTFTNPGKCRATTIPSRRALYSTTGTPVRLVS